LGDGVFGWDECAIESIDDFLDSVIVADEFMFFGSEFHDVNVVGLVELSKLFKGKVYYFNYFTDYFNHFKVVVFQGPYRTTLMGGGMYVHPQH
jgi:hypothetical protein